jgi:hypothetical protein
MLDEVALRSLAEDIAENGLRHDIVLDSHGRILDGRNRYAACRIAEVEPTFVTYDGPDPVGFVLSENQERRHMTLPERAAATTLSLATDGKRKNGRWARGAVRAINESVNSGTWSQLMAHAGLALDVLGQSEVERVSHGEVALDELYRLASQEREKRKRRRELPADLGALVDAGKLSLEDALRRAALPAEYSERVASGQLALDEAEHLATREKREHDDALRRRVDTLLAFLNSYRLAAALADDPWRDEILAHLEDVDRDRFLIIEKETSWPSTRI